MLNRTGDPKARYSFGATVWPELPILALHGQPAESQIGREGRKLRAERLGQLSSDRDVLFRLDAASDRDDPFGLREVNGLLGLAEGRFWFLADRRRINARRERLYRGRAERPFSPRRPGTIRSGTSPGGARTFEGDIGVHTALEDWSHEQQAAFIFQADAVRSQRSIETRCELRRVSRASGTCGKDDVRGRLSRDEGGQRLHESIGGIGVQGVVFRGDDLSDVGRRELAGGRCDAGAQDDDLHRPAHLLRSRDRFPRRAIERSVSLLGDNR
jgi:hypothetical protein